MVHDCVDWTARPPARKTPLLILTRGDDHVYTLVPNELKTLEDIARREFDLGDVDVRLSSSCVSLCHGQPARITEHAWEHISPYIGCATVEVSGPRPRTVEMTTEDEHDREQDDGHENDGSRDTVRDEQDTTSDHGNDSSVPEDGDPYRDDASTRVVSEGDVKGAQSAAHLHRLSKRITQEKRASGNDMRPQSSYTESEYDIPTQAGESDKLVIRVAHRPSKQESKFTAKGTTRVAKVLAGACKSFGLDANRATLYLIVSVEDADGHVENLFPCDRNDTIARAGAERDTEARFLLKMAGEA